MVFALLNGLAMSQMIDGYSPYRAESVIATYKAMVHAALDIPRAADSG
jgi:hypothetical protein